MTSCVFYEALVNFIIYNLIFSLCLTSLYLFNCCCPGIIFPKEVLPHKLYLKLCFLQNQKTEGITSEPKARGNQMLG